MAVAVFVLGGIASGKSSTVMYRDVGTLDHYAATDPRAHQPRDGFSVSPTDRRRLARLVVSEIGFATTRVVGPSRF